MSTEESDTVAEVPSSQVPVLANALPDSQKINLTKLAWSMRCKERDFSWSLH
jgi:hypothetical protein